MTTHIEDTGAATPPGPPSVDGLVDRAVRLAMSRGWTVEAAGGALLEAAEGDAGLLGRARVQLLKTNNAQSQVGRRAMLTLAYAMAATAQTAPDQDRSQGALSPNFS